MKWIAPAAFAAILLLAGAANLALDGGPQYDRGAYDMCMEDPPAATGIERQTLLEMPMHRIVDVCRCHAGVCRRGQGGI